MTFSVRWAIRDDLRPMERIDALAFGDLAWGQDELIKALRDQSTIGMVCETVEPNGLTSIAGFMIYRLERHVLDLLTIAVDPEFRGRGAGRAMVCRISRKLSPDRRRFILTRVPERNLGALRFFRSACFEAYAFADDQIFMRFDRGGVGGRLSEYLAATYAD